MRKRTKKIFATLITAAMLSANMSAGALSASALNQNTYNLHYANGAPSSAIVLQKTIRSISTTSRSFLKESCTYHQSATHSNGTIAYATYLTHYRDDTGAAIILHGTLYHYAEQPEHTVSYSSVVPKNIEVITNYNLHNYSGLGNCQISGSITS